MGQRRRAAVRRETAGLPLRSPVSKPLHPLRCTRRRHRARPPRLGMLFSVLVRRLLLLLIREEGLLPGEEIDRIMAQAPKDLVAFQDRAAALDLADRTPMASWLERFHSGETHHA